jgi:integrase
MGTVHKLSTGHEPVTLAAAVDAYLAGFDHPETAGTRRTYAHYLGRLTKYFGTGTSLDTIGPHEVAGWFTAEFASKAPATWNVAFDTLRTASRDWIRRGWCGAELTGELKRRKARPDRSRALSRAEVENLLTRNDISLRERTMWRMLYETAARSAEVLRLNVEDLDLANRRARVVRKGGAVDIIVWQTHTARLLPRLLKGRTRGPLFLTDRKARVPLSPIDIDPESGHARLSYGQAEAIFKAASGGATLHQLRHSALTHDAEDGTNTAMLMARSGHTSVTSLAKYARVSAEALARHQAERDPARRR